jgi:hypothetical protein
MATPRTNTRPKGDNGGEAKAGAQAKTAAGEDTARVEIEAKVPMLEVRKPLYASVGAADLAVEKLRTLPVTTTAEVKKLSDRVSTLPARMPNQVGSAVRSLPGAVTAQLFDLQEKATQIYNDFASRGERRVANIRRNPAAKEAVNRTKTAVRQTRAARTSAREAVNAAGKAVGNAAAAASVR